MKNKTTKMSALVVAALTTFMTPFMISAVNIALPAIQAQFSIDSILLSWIATAYLLSTAVFLVPTGKIADIHGRKKIFNAGIVVFTLSTVLSAFAPSVYVLIVFRVIQGVGAAMIMTTGIAIISSVFPLNERGKAIGITVASVYIGLSSGPFVGGLLTQHFGWRSIFLINGPIGFCALVLSLRYLKGEWADARGQKFDMLGTLLYALALTAVMYGVSRLTEIIGAVLIVTGLLGLILFIIQERRIQHPVFEVGLFSTNRVFAYSSLAALINYAATFAVMFLLSLYLQYIKEMTPQAAGLILVAQPVVQALFSPIAGRISDRVEPAVIASSGMALTALGLVLLVFIDIRSSTEFIVVTLLLLGLGFALFSSPNMNAIMSSVEKKYYGIASGTVATMRLIGQMLSMGIVTVVFALMIGEVAITPDTYADFLKSVKTAFVVFAALCFCGIYFSLYRGRLRK